MCFTAKAPLGVGALLHLSFDDTTAVWGTVLGTPLRPQYESIILPSFRFHRNDNAQLEKVGMGGVGRAGLGVGGSATRYGLCSGT